MQAWLKDHQDGKTSSKTAPEAWGTFSKTPGKVSAETTKSMNEALVEVDIYEAIIVKEKKLNPGTQLAITQRLPPDKLGGYVRGPCLGF